MLNLEDLHPKIRGISFILGITGILVTHQIELLILFWVFLLILLLYSNVLEAHFNFLLYIILPLFFMLLIIWGWIIGKAPKVIGNIYDNGYLYAVFMTLRLVVLGGIFQVFFLTIPNEYLIHIFKSWGIRGNFLVIITGAYSVFPDLVGKADKILTARYARGMVKNRNFLNRIKQFPYILKPLVIEVLVSAFERAEAWHQKDILSKLEKLGEVDEDTFKIKMKEIILIGFISVFLLTSIIIQIVYE